jgi:hypothetical protein
MFRQLFDRRYFFPLAISPQWCNIYSFCFIGIVGVVEFVLLGALYLVFHAKFKYSGIGLSVIAGAVQIGLSIPVIYAINRWFPFIVGRTRKAVAN